MEVISINVDHIKIKTEKNQKHLFIPSKITKINSLHVCINNVFL